MTFRTANGITVVYTGTAPGRSVGFADPSRVVARLRVRLSGWR